MNKVYKDIFDAELQENDIVRYFTRNNMVIISIGVIVIEDEKYYIKSNNNELLNIDNYKCIKYQSIDRVLFSITTESEFYIDTEVLLDITYKYMRQYIYNNHRDVDIVNNVFDIVLKYVYGSDILMNMELLKYHNLYLNNNSTCNIKEVNEE